MREELNRKMANETNLKRRRRRTRRRQRRREIRRRTIWKYLCTRANESARAKNSNNNNNNTVFIVKLWKIWPWNSFLFNSWLSTCLLTFLLFLFLFLVSFHCKFFNIFFNSVSMSVYMWFFFLHHLMLGQRGKKMSHSHKAFGYIRDKCERWKTWRGRASQQTSKQANKWQNIKRSVQI